MWQTALATGHTVSSCCNADDFGRLISCTGISISEILTTQNAAQPGGLPYNLLFYLFYSNANNVLYTIYALNTVVRDLRVPPGCAPRGN